MSQPSRHKFAGIITSGKSAQRKETRVEAPSPFRRRAGIGLAAAASLMVAVTTVAGPARADTPPDMPSWVPAGVSAAIAAAQQTGDRVKIDDATTQTAEFYATPDGKVVGKIAADAQRFARDGAWVPINLTLREQADGSVAPAAYPQEMRFSGARTAETGDLAVMGSGDDKVAVGWKGALPEPKLDGSKATYADAMPGVDLVVQATRSGFEQFAVLKSAAAAKYADQIALPLSGPGVSVVRADNKGNIQIHSRRGVPLATIPTPMMWDSKSAKHGGPPRRLQVGVSITHTASVQARQGLDATDPVNVTLKPDQTWLTSPDTVYPVTIDPYYDWSTTVTSTTVVKDQATGWPDSDSLFVGKYDNTWTGRSFISWWATGLYGFQVDQATLHLANPYSTTCSQTPWEIWTTEPITADTSWDNQPEWQEREATSTSTSCNDGWVTADATSFFQRAVEKEVGQPTMGLRAADETATDQYKQFWSWNTADSSKSPFVEVWYSLPPNPVDPDAALWATQSTLSDFRDWTVAEVGTNSGYIDSVNDADATSVTLLWAGAPNAMQASILAEAERRTITATVVQRQYTKDQLNQAADAAVASTTSGTGVFAGFTINTAEPLSPEFDGLVITGQHKSNPADTAAADQALSQQATQALGVAVKVQTAPMFENTSGSTRGTDTSPFNAGAFMWPGCSLGFGLRIGSATYTTTARHCHGPKFRANDRSSAPYYTTKQLSTDGAARVLTGGGSQIMFYGGYDSSLKATVIGSKNVGAGDYVCTSGGNSGSHCGGGANMKVRKGSVRYDDGDGYVTMLVADRKDGGVAAVRGDSGGPVYQNKTALDVYAVGMIQSGGGRVPCVPVRQSTVDCYKTVVYTSINTIIRGVPNSSLVHK